MTTPTEPEALAAVEIAQQMLAHLDECDRIGKFASIWTDHIRQICEALPTPAAQMLAGEGEAVPFQQRVQPWMMECFGAEISGDMLERSDRAVEEMLELSQEACAAIGVDFAPRAHALVDYVAGRPVGEIRQEVGGVMVTLAALCLAAKIDMHEAGEIELARILQPHIVQKIRAKQAAKPTGSALPVAHPPAAEPKKGDFRCHNCKRIAEGLVAAPKKCTDCMCSSFSAVAYSERKYAPAAEPVWLREAALGVVLAGLVEGERERLQGKIDECNQAIAEGSSDPWYREDLDRFRQTLRILNEEIAALATPARTDDALPRGPRSLNIADSRERPASIAALSPAPDRGEVVDKAIRHEERKRIIAQGCIHTRKASENADYDRPDVSQWQSDQSEWFDPTICEIVSEYAAWRDTQDALKPADATPAGHWLEPYRTMDAGGSPETAGQVGHSWLLDIARAEHDNDPAALEIDMPRLTEDGTAQILYRGPKVIAACFIVRDPMNFAILFRYRTTPAGEVVQIGDDKFETIAAAFAKEFYGPGFDPFDNPEAYDLIERGLRAALQSGEGKA